MIQKILPEIEGRLQEAGIPRRVSGRENTLPIYRGAQRAALSPIMDIYAFRVIVHDPSCLLMRTSARCTVSISRVS